MDAWVWWLVVALLLGVGELLTTTLVLAMMAGGAIAALVAALVGASVPVQLIVFALVSLLLVLVVRPVARRHLQTPGVTRSGVQGLIGAEAVVLADVGPRDGRVKLAGEVWSARSYDSASTFPVDTEVFVVAIDGATALVAER